ncbi:MAG: hypothetical protein KDI63_15725, partial [Gammaproteobacteria bacterium]|nr:hypothetical protein [Gammaproteobacteria bacterium]
YYPASYPLLLLALAWSVLFRKQSELLFLGLLFGTVLWVEFNLGWWLGEGQGFRFGAAHLTLSAGLLAVGCCLASLLTYSHRYWWTDYGTLMRVWVVRLGVLLLLALSFEDLWREYLEKAREEPATHFAIAGICFGVSAAAHLASRGRWGGGLWFSVIYLLLFTTPLLGAIAGDAKLYQVAANLLLIGSGVLLIRRGIAEGRSHDFYLGVSVILTTGLLRYIDLIGDYVGAAILFAVFAAILLGSARYWRIKHPVGDRPK